MANKLKFKRGLAAGIPNGDAGEPLFTTDSYDLYIGKGDGTNQRFQKFIASGTSSQFLKGDGSLDSTTYQSTAQKGVANGYASLDGGGKVPIGQLPSSIMEYKGTWDASTNTPTLADGTGDTGDVYRVSVAGSQNLGSGTISFEVGDYVIYNGTIWQKSDTTDAVASVNSKTGVVTLYTDDITEDGSPVNLWFTDARARAAISLTTTGTSGAATYSSSTGVLNIPQYQAALTNPVTGTGTTNYLSKFTGASAIGDSQIFDNGTFVGVGTNSVEAGYLFGVNGDIKAANIKLTTLSTTGIVYASGGLLATQAFADDRIAYWTGSTLAGDAAFKWVANSRLLINAPTDDTTTAVQINGNIKASAATFSSSVTATTQGASNGFNTGAFIAKSNGNTFRYTQVGYDNSGNYGWIQALEQGTAYTNLIINGAGGNVGIGTTNPTFRFDIETTNLTVGRFYSNAAGTRNNILIQNSGNYNYGVIGVVSATGGISGDVYALGYSASGSTAMTPVINWTSGGNVGIGTTSPLVPIHVETTGTSTSMGGNVISTFRSQASGRAATLQLSDNTNSNYISSLSGALGFGSGGTELMRITSGGDVGIGQTSITAVGSQRVLQIGTTGGGTVSHYDGSSLAYRTSASSSGVDLYNPNATPTIIYTSGSERMRITSGGHSELLIGTTSANWSNANRGLLELNGASSGSALLGLKINNSSRAYFYHNNNHLYIEQMLAGGSIYMISVSAGVYLAADGTSWTSNSDIRLKNITGKIDNALDSLMNIRAVRHTWKSDSSNKEHLSLIAQDVEKEFPQVIDKNKLPSKANETQTDETDYLGIRYTELVPVLVKAIQEQQEQIQQLKTQINGN